VKRSQLRHKPEKKKKMTKKNAHNSTEDRIHSAMDDVKSSYKDIEEKTRQSITDAKDSAVTWVEEGVSNMKSAADDTAKAIDKNVKQGLSQYNAKAQELADKAPGGLGDKVIRYPWVAISLSLLMGVGMGVGLGLLLKPTRSK
jgi:vacuolar-type H+-ATPase subunit H